MALIGQSKNEGLYQRVTEEGSKYRELRYLDVSDTEPLISGYHRGFDPGFTPGIPGAKEEAGGAGIISDAQRAVTVRIDDTARIMKLLTKRQGIKWEAHNTELAAIQNKLESKRGQLSQSTSDSTGGNVWNALTQVWNTTIKPGLIDTARVTAETLAQTAVAGTGEHFSAWYEKTYLKNGISVEALLGIPGASGSAAAEALAGGHVTIHTEDPVAYYQIPEMDDYVLGVARKPKNQNGVPVEGLGLGWKQTVQSHNHYLSGSATYLQFLNQMNEEQLEQDDRYFTGLHKPITGSLGQETIEQAQKPGYGKNPKVKDALERGERAAYYGVGFYDSLNQNLWKDGDSYLDKVKNDLGESNPKAIISTTSTSNKPGLSPDSETGPWKPEGTLALVAKDAQSSGPWKGASDGGYHTSEVDKLTGLAPGADTRVDNGRIEMIPFWIRAITPGGRPLRDNGYLFFEANLDSYSDNYDASWKGTQYVGRADKFWTYEGFDRQISFAFKMVAHSKAHLKPIYNRLNGLLSMTAPNYSEGVFMRGTLAEITIGDLLSKQLGFIKSVGLKWETDYMWETDEGTIRVPHVLDVSIQFTPIHQFIPQTRRRYFELYGEGNEGEPSFIGNDRLYTTYKTATE